MTTLHCKCFFHMEDNWRNKCSLPLLLSIQRQISTIHLYLFQENGLYLAVLSSGVFRKFTDTEMNVRMKMNIRNVRNKWNVRMHPSILPTERNYEQCIQKFHPSNPRTPETFFTNARHRKQYLSGKKSFMLFFLWNVFLLQLLLLGIVLFEK